MASLKYTNEEGADTINSDANHYSQLVEFPDSKIVKLSGQGGWDSEVNVDPDWKRQIDKAFDNVDKVLKAAGLRGWEDVYLLRSYQTNMEEHFEYFIETLKRKVPSHRPIWTALGVRALGMPSMIVEIEVEAYRST
ncbi:RutC family protein YjgH [Pseudocercospora fuligena]|uniref:RutC family protein YjgH n=1 Tax=Pseudocercospora fuligena TaxID=685502 RepID=A0A8H6VJK2_9PEZI|nr:RutC family protein YjgH [Pseudocercospora fuligena]